MSQVATVLSQQEVHVLHHSLGMTQKDIYGKAKEYRNHFCTTPDTTDYPYCKSLEEAGLMCNHGPLKIAGDMLTFVVTEEGRRRAREYLPPEPKLTKSQRRYREWLHADTGETFAEWLGITNAKAS